MGKRTLGNGIGTRRSARSVASLLLGLALLGSAVVALGTTGCGRPDDDRKGGRVEAVTVAWIEYYDSKYTGVDPTKDRVFHLIANLMQKAASRYRLEGAHNDEDTAIEHLADKLVACLDGPHRVKPMKDAWAELKTASDAVTAKLPKSAQEWNDVADGLMHGHD